MDRELARILIQTGFRSSREMNDVLLLLKSQCGGDEYERLRKPIVSAIAEITEATLTPAFTAHPDLKAEVEAQIAKYGRFA